MERIVLICLLALIPLMQLQTPAFLNLEDKDSKESLRDKQLCNLMVPGGEADCTSLNSNFTNKDYRCCYEEYQIDMTPYTMCRYVRNDKDSIKDEKNA